MGAKDEWVTGDTITADRLNYMLAEYHYRIYENITANSIVRIYDDTYNDDYIIPYDKGYGSPFHRDVDASWTRVCMLSSTKGIVIFKDDVADRVKAKVIHFSSGKISYIASSATTVNSASTASICKQPIKLDSTRILISYMETNTVKCVVLTANVDDTITVGSEATIAVAADAATVAMAETDTDKVCIIWRNSINYARIVSVSGSTITLGDYVDYTGDNPALYTSVSNVACKLDTDKVLVCFEYNARVYGNVLTISDTTVTVNAGGNLGIDNPGGTYLSLCQTTTDKAIIFYHIESTTTIRSLDISVSGTTASTTGYKDIDVAADPTYVDHDVCLNSSTRATFVFMGNSANDVYARDLTIDSGAIDVVGSANLLDSANPLDYGQMVAIDGNYSIVAYQAHSDDGWLYPLYQADKIEQKDGVALTAHDADSQAVVLRLHE